MLASFLLALREGIEAALIIGILISVLKRTNRDELKPAVWAGVIAASIISILAAILLSFMGTAFEGRAEQIYEGIAMLLAAGMLTWMIFWMRKQSHHLRENIEKELDEKAESNGKAGVFWIAFLSVGREGLELAIFLLAASFAIQAGLTLAGAALGLLSAVVLGYLLFNSTKKLNIRAFFNVTNVLLLMFAAGMVAYGVHELNEAGIIPNIIEHIYDINHVVYEKGNFGLFLKALLGYNGNPSLSETIAYLTYVAIIGTVAVLPGLKKSDTAAAA
ncbi:MAG: FTR1 family protein [Anaerolineaceae bacterium]|nr:FTR1 family protein [Anaerolineaceae bacterium]